MTEYEQKLYDVIVDWWHEVFVVNPPPMMNLRFSSFLSLTVTPSLLTLMNGDLATV